MQFPTELEWQEQIYCQTTLRAFQVVDMYTSISQFTLTMQVNQESSYAKKHLPWIP